MQVIREIFDFSAVIFLHSQYYRLRGWLEEAAQWRDTIRSECLSNVPFMVLAWKNNSLMDVLRAEDVRRLKTWSAGFIAAWCIRRNQVFLVFRICLQWDVCVLTHDLHVDTVKAISFISRQRGCLSAALSTAYYKLYLLNCKQELKGAKSHVEEDEGKFITSGEDDLLYFF